jgi:hypothetical protein
LADALSSKTDSSATDLVRKFLQEGIFLEDFLRQAIGSK